jgi:hypothetical protein
MVKTVRDWCQYGGLTFLSWLVANFRFFMLYVNGQICKRFLAFPTNMYVRVIIWRNVIKTWLQGQYYYIDVLIIL